jgi:hypothetical protein
MAKPKAGPAIAKKPKALKKDDTIKQILCLDSKRDLPCYPDQIGGVIALQKIKKETLKSMLQDMQSESPIKDSVSEIPAKYQVEEVDEIKEVTKKTRDRPWYIEEIIGLIECRSQDTIKERLSGSKSTKQRDVIWENGVGGLYRAMLGYDGMPFKERTGEELMKKYKLIVVSA